MLCTGKTLPYEKKEKKLSYINLETIEEKEIVPGFHARMVHTDNMTVAYWNIEEGASLPDHTHPHEQIANLIEGRFEFSLDGETKVLEPGMVVVIPGDVPHSGKALTPCKIIDVFYPVREDYR